MFHAVLKLFFTKMPSFYRIYLPLQNNFSKRYLIKIFNHINVNIPFQKDTFANGLIL